MKTLLLHAGIYEDYPDLRSYISSVIKKDYPKNAELFIKALYKCSTQEKYFELLGKAYDSICYNKVKFPIYDLPTIVMWMDKENELADLYEKWSMEHQRQKEYEFKKKRQEHEEYVRKQQEAHQQQIEERKIAREEARALKYRQKLEAKNKVEN